MLVAHLIPAYHGTLHAQVAVDMTRTTLVCAERGWKYVPICIDMHGIERVRNLGVKQAYELGADLLLMQDADTFSLPPAFGPLEPLYSSMERCDAAVVGAAVITRNGERMNCEPAVPGRIYAGEVGTGLMLIDLRKLRDLPQPWFVQDVASDGITLRVGEDIGFCRLVKSAGRVVVVDYSFNTGHGYSSVNATNVA